MKRSNRTRVCLALGLVFLAAAAAPPVFADISLTASTGTGVMFGVAKELVYSVAVSTNKSYIKSELDWDLHALSYVNAALSLRTSAGFVAALDVRLGVPGKTGVMTDSDWLNYSTTGLMTKTHYSQSDCYTERAILLDMQAGWDAPVASWLSFKPFLALGFMDFKWSGRDGYFQYPTTGLPFPDASSDPKKPISGTSIIYQQTYLIPEAGLAARFVGKGIACSVSLAFSPYVFCNDVDNHEFSFTDFYDNMEGGFLVEPGVSLELKVRDKVTLLLSASYRHIEGLIGTTTTVVTGLPATPGLVSGTYPNGAGASFDAMDASLSLAWSL